MRGRGHDRNYPRWLVRFRPCTPRLPLGESEARVCKSKSCARDRNPKQTVPKKQATEAGRKRVFVSDSPVLRDHRKCSDAKRVEQGPGMLPLQVLKKLPGHRTARE